MGEWSEKERPRGWDRGAEWEGGVLLWMMMIMLVLLVLIVEETF